MSRTFVKWEGEHIMRLVTEFNHKAMIQATTFFKGEVKKTLSKMGTGKAYKRKSVTHIASIAGKPPAPDLGHLRASISKQTKKQKMIIKGFVGSDLEKLAASTDVGTDLEYGFYLEVGTKNMKARPFLRPTLMAQRKKILEFFEKANK